MQQTSLPAIEGIVPSYIWIFLIVSIGLATIVVLFGKVMNVIDDFKAKRAAHENNIVEEPVGELSEKLAKVEKGLADIKGELVTINGKLDNDNRRIRALETEQKDIHDGFSVLATASLAMLEHEMHNGNGEQMESAKDKLIAYLTKR